MKHLLIAAYIFSVVYCYMQFDALVESCIKVFKERHPLIPIDANRSWKGARATIEMIGVSLIPVLNLLLSLILSKLDDAAITQIIQTIEVEHWKEIKEAESVMDKFEDLDKYF